MFGAALPVLDVPGVAEAQTLTLTAIPAAEQVGSVCFTSFASQ